MDNQCPECDGVGFSCGVHDTTDGCDCEEQDRDQVCGTCSGTGVVYLEDEEGDDE